MDTLSTVIGREGAEKFTEMVIGFAIRWVTEDGAIECENLMAEHMAEDLTKQCLEAFKAKVSH